MVYDSKPTQKWLSHKDMMSPTAALKSIILNSVIDTYEKRNIMVYDIPNAFIQAKIPEIP
jgi:hypothetical protein